MPTRLVHSEKSRRLSVGVVFESRSQAKECVVTEVAAEEVKIDWQVINSFTGHGEEGVAGNGELAVVRDTADASRYRLFLALVTIDRWRRCNDCWKRERVHIYQRIVVRGREVPRFGVVCPWYSSLVRSRGPA